MIKGFKAVGEQRKASRGNMKSELVEEAREREDRSSRYHLRVTGGFEKWSAGKYLRNWMESQKPLENFQPQVESSRRFDEKLLCTTYFLWTE